MTFLVSSIREAYAFMIMMAYIGVCVSPIFEGKPILGHWRSCSGNLFNMISQVRKHEYSHQWCKDALHKVEEHVFGGGQRHFVEKEAIVFSRGQSSTEVTGDRILENLFAQYLNFMSGFSMILGMQMYYVEQKNAIVFG